MGRSAKLHKRNKMNSTPAAGGHIEQAATVGAAKKKAVLKARSASRKPGAEGHVLGGADYVDIMLGGRRRAREAAQKLPQDDPE
ncbi:hypothetical protein FA95DRAFT_1554925 [Auriscalpium vulgare]|uniref:Uncharacterized protein n=1 Tax=Auriscalpium vulgare TaxID=40419 RepID=A0ACB8S4L7_9AGAM|nr:hypothetical protein FA95DRAFT_1554925 [Auriscalpium vulgare]